MKRAKKTIKLASGTEIELKGGDGGELKGDPESHPFFEYSEAAISNLGTYTSYDRMITAMKRDER